jgi:amino acid transporter
LTYALVCAAVPVLRRRSPDAPAYRLPGGPLVPALGLMFCVVLALYMDRSQLGIIGLVGAAAVVNWLVARNRPALAATQPT